MIQLQVKVARSKKVLCISTVFPPSLMSNISLVKCILILSKALFDPARKSAGLSTTNQAKKFLNHLRHINLSSRKELQRRVYKYLGYKKLIPVCPPTLHNT